MKGMLAKFVRDRALERNPELQLVLPENSMPPHFQEFETKLCNTLNPLVRKDFRMYLFSSHVEKTEVLAWLAPFKRQVKEAVEAAKFQVFLPGTLLFEAHEKTRHLKLVTKGQVTIEYDSHFDHHQDSSQTISVASVIQIRSERARAEAIKEILECGSEDSDESSEAEDEADNYAAPESPKSPQGDSPGSAQDVPKREKIKKARKDKSDADSIGNSWRFAMKVLDRIDEQLEIDFVDDDENVLKSNLPVWDAPCVFGENSLWFPGMTNGFSGRSVNYTELLRIPTPTLIQIAKSDPRIKCRFDAFREAVEEYTSKKMSW
jgi:hypothetical protein